MCRNGLVWPSLGREVARQRGIVIREQGVIFGVQGDDRDQLLLQRFERQALQVFVPGRAINATDLIPILTVQHSDTCVVTSREHNPAHAGRASAAAGQLCCVRKQITVRWVERSAAVRVDNQPGVEGSVLLITLGISIRLR